MKKTVLVLLGLLACATSFASTWVYAGYNFNYNAGMDNKTGYASTSKGNGLRISFISEMDTIDTLGVYTSAGIDFYSKEMNKALSQFGGEGVLNTVPVELGLACYLGHNEKFRFCAVIGVGVDLSFFRGSARMNTYGQKISTTFNGYGFSFNVFSILGVEHQFKRISIRYGAEFKIPLYTIAVVDSTVRVNNNATHNVDVNNYSIFDGFSSVITPYVSIGFRFGR